MPSTHRLTRRCHVASLWFCLPFLLGLLAPPAAARGLDRTEIVRELGYDALLAIDARQTTLAVEQGYREVNPLLGAHPSPGAINRHMAVSMLAHGLVSWLLPQRMRAPWQRASIAVEALVIGHNATLGVRWRF
jgi:hypothetical protein